MPPPQKPWSEEMREHHGFASLTAFFKPPPKPGRPAGSVKAKPGPRPAAPPPAEATPPPTREPAPAPAPAPAAAAPKGGAQKRVNYSAGEPLKRLTKAVEDWLGKTGTYLEEPAMSKARFAALAEIPLGTFKHYVHDDPTKRYKLGCGVGESGKKLLDEDAAQFVVDTIRRRDRADDGMTRRESIDMIQDLRPELSQKQAMSQFDRNVRPQNK
eukprot:5292672-Prymnesium_polylepis.1